MPFSINFEGFSVQNREHASYRACQAEPSLADKRQAGPSETYQVKHRISLRSKANQPSKENQVSKAKQSKQATHSKSNKSNQRTKPNQSKTSKQTKEKHKPSQLKENQGK